MDKSRLVRLPKMAWKYPTLIFAVRQRHPKSVAVVKAFTELSPDPRERPCNTRCFATEGDAAYYFANGGDPLRAIVLFDGYPESRGEFTVYTRLLNECSKEMPAWVPSVRWGVNVYGNRPENCARQLRADFLRHFKSRLTKLHLPWGEPKGTVSPPGPQRFRGTSCTVSGTTW